MMDLICPYTACPDSEQTDSGVKFSIVAPDRSINCILEKLKAQRNEMVLEVLKFCNFPIILYLIL